MTTAEQEERQQRIRDALDKVYNHEHTEDDLAVICYETGVNWAPPGRKNGTFHKG